ncbi:MAG: hypothetical protein HOE48_06340 [Candidatus Latescibacteria bacterium]|nr:hypothetical protein [Candidatus Latescibacterota bacterium]MBT5830981.1 hypothetical protein [Candidatus Latescibacterota bacterium]
MPTEPSSDPATTELGLRLIPHNVEINFEGLSQSQIDQISLGSYLVNGAAGCIGCHNSATGEHLAGGNEFPAFFLPPDIQGNTTLFARNLTPDPDTGLKLTEAQFIEAMKTGKDFHDSENSGQDIVLRAKYHLPDNNLVDIGFATLAQLSTGDNKDFLGTGDNTIYPFFIFSRSISDRLTPHANIGYEFNLTRSKLSAIEYAIGFDYGTNKYTIAGEFLASNELDGDGIGDDILETAWGIKWNPARQYLVAFNTQFALNDAGLRSTFITTLSLEYNF